MKPSRRHLSRQRGFSLVEFMVAVTIGLILLTGLATIVLSSSQSRTELEKASRQLENGRYAVQVLSEDISLAGFYGDYVPASVTWTTPDPCALALQNMGFAPPSYTDSNGGVVNGTNATNVPLAIHGYAGGVAAPTTCDPYLTHRKDGTHVVVIRRLNTAAVAAASAAQGAYYLQVSNCADTPKEPAFILHKNPAEFVLHTTEPAGTPLTCLSGPIAQVRQYVVHIYYISTCNDCSGSGDGVPTLKLAELLPGTSACMTGPAVDCGSIAVRPIAEGIENLQLEYGLDNSGTGDGTADLFQSSPAAADWATVVAAKVFLLARNTEPTSGYRDTKQYSLQSDGTALAGTPFNDEYKRHVYSVTVRANNLAGRRGG